MNKNTTDLQKLRMKIDFVDKVLISVLAKRMELVEAIGKYKKNHNLKLLDKKRWGEVIKTRITTGKPMGLPPDFVHEIFKLIHQYSLSIQKRPKL